MEADGLVTAETVIQTKYPNKRVFALTDAGRDESRRYGTVPSPPGEFKDELVIKMLGIDVTDPAALLADVARRRKWCLERLRRDRGAVDTMVQGQDADTYAQTATTWATTCGNCAPSGSWKSRSPGATRSSE